MQERTSGLLRQDYREVKGIDVKLEEASRASTSPVKQHESTDLLAKVNERNRKANVEAVRWAKLVETE
jgi:RNA polymerase-associated protein RTF1